MHYLVLTKLILRPKEFGIPNEINKASAMKMEDAESKRAGDTHRCTFNMNLQFQHSLNHVQKEFIPG